MMLDIKGSSDTSGVSPGSPLTSPPIPLDTLQENKLKKPVRRYNLSTLSSKPDNSFTRPPRSSKTLEESPKPVNHSSRNTKKPKNQNRESFVTRKSRSSVVRAVESPNPSKNIKNSLRKTPRDVRPPKPKKFSKNIDKSSNNTLLPQKNRKSSRRAADSSEDENSPRIGEKPTHLRKKRKLYCLPDFTEDLTHMRDDLSERSSSKYSGTSNRFKKTQGPVERLEIPKKPRVIHVEYCKTPKNDGTTSRGDNPVPESSEQLDRSRISSEKIPNLDISTQGIDSSLTSAGTASSETPGTPVVPTDVSGDSGTMQESPESLKDGDHSMNVLPTQKPPWTPSITPQKSPVPPETSIHPGNTPDMESETSSGVSSGCPSTSPTIPSSPAPKNNSQGKKSLEKDENDSDSDIEATSSTRNLKNRALNYNISDESSEDEAAPSKNREDPASEIHPVKNLNQKATSSTVKKPIRRSSRNKLPPNTPKNNPTSEKPNELEKITAAIRKYQSQSRDKPPADMKTEAPKNMGCSLYEHQLYALSWLSWRESSDPAGGILGDDMGVGKTTMIIALIMKSLESEREEKKEKDSGDKNSVNPSGTLIICPAQLVAQWNEEIMDKGDISKVTIYGTAKPSMKTLKKSLVVITSYDTLARNDTSNDRALFNVHWKRVVLDEAHCIKNPEALKSKVVNKLKSDKRWALTGTPIHNEVKDIFPILRFLDVKPFHELKTCHKWMDGGDTEGMARLHSILQCIMLRRVKNSLVMPELPRKTNRQIIVVLEPDDERLVYDRVMIVSTKLVKQYFHQKRENERKIALGDAYVWNDDYESYEFTKKQMEFLARRGPVQRVQILTLILRCRQICCHPALIKDMLDKEDFVATGAEEPDEKVLNEANNLLDGLGVFEDDEETIGIDERVLEKGNIILSSKNPVFSEAKASSKMKKVFERVLEIIKNGEKIVVVSDWVKYLEIMRKHLENMPETSGKIGFFTGKQTGNERAAIMEAFNEKPEMMVLLMSLKAGGLGLNLTGANHVFILDVHWNPQLGIQAENRVHRIGQKKNVFIHKFIAKDTIEESVQQLQEKKLGIAEDVMAGGTFSGGINDLQLEDMFTKNHN